MQRGIHGIIYASTCIKMLEIFLEFQPTLEMRDLTVVSIRGFGGEMILKVDYLGNPLTEMDSLKNPKVFS